MSVLSERSTLRLIDANANRALEGMRVCEEIVRFHLAGPRALDPPRLRRGASRARPERAQRVEGRLFRRCRRLRHAIARAVRSLPYRAAELVAVRNSRADVGRRAPSPAVSSLERLLLINLQRVKEALRVLEECSRLAAPRRRATFQHLRFETYEVERELLRGLAPLRHR